MYKQIMLAVDGNEASDAAIMGNTLRIAPLLVLLV